MWHLCVTGKFADFSKSGIFFSEPTTPHLTMHIVSMPLRPCLHLSLTGQKLLPSTLHMCSYCTVHKCTSLFLFDILLIHQMQHVLHFGGNLKNTYSDHHTTILGEQLVWEQEDPVQEEHREGSGGSQHVRCEGCTGCRRQPWRISRSEYLFFVESVLNF